MRELDEDIVIEQVALSRQYTQPPFDWERIPLSKSAVFTYERCAYRYWLSYLMKVRGERMEAMEHGKDIHTALEEVYDKLDEESISKGIDEDEFRKSYQQKLPKDSSIDTFIDIEWQRYEATKDKEQFFPLYRELFHYDTGIAYYGRVDRIDVTNDGDYVVVDYKTGKYSNWQLRNYRFEMAGYKHLVDKMQLFEKSVKYACIVFMRNATVWFEEFKPATIRAFYNRVERVRGRIRDSKPDRFPKKINQQCVWCPVQFPCLIQEEEIV